MSSPPSSPEISLEESPPRTPSPNGSDGTSCGSHTLVSSAPSTPGSLKKIAISSTQLSPLSWSSPVRATFDDQEVEADAPHIVESRERLSPVTAPILDIWSQPVEEPEARDMENIRSVMYSIPPSGRRQATGVIPALGVPDSSENFVTSLYRPGLAWIDKSVSMALYDGGGMQHTCQMPAIHRPAGFGKTSFVQMLNVYVDAKAYAPVFNGAFDDTPMSARTLGAKSYQPFLILPLDFAEIPYTTPDVFEYMIRRHIDNKLREFLMRYHEVLEVDYTHGVDPRLYDPDGFLYIDTAIASWLDWGRSCYRVLITIDNYDHPQRASGNHPAVQDALERRFIDYLPTLFDQLVSGLMFGTIPREDDALGRHDILRIWKPYVKDCTHHSDVATAMGFTAREIRELCAVLDLAHCAPEILAKVEEHHFSTYVDEGVYSMAEVLDILRPLVEHRPSHEVLY